MTTTRLPLARDSAACSALSRHNITVKNDASCSRRPLTATRSSARASGVGRVKTHETRTVRLPRSLAEELGAFLADRPHDRDDLVFTAPRGGPLRESKFVPGRFKPAIGATNQALAQLPKDGRPDPLPEALRLYDLRHTAASLSIRQGASIKAVQRQLGHATASITLDTYGHLFPDEMEALAGRLEVARTEALAAQARTQRGPAVVPIRERAGQ
jgi:integrase